MLKNDKEIAVNYDTTIKKSNEFSLAKLSYGMSLLQTQLLSYALFMKPQDRKVTFKRADMIECFQMKDYKTEQANRDAAKLSTLQFSTVDLEADKFSYRNIFSEFNYNKGVFEVIWTPEIMPHIEDLQEKYVMTDLTISSKFRSSFSWILYDVIKAHYRYFYKEYSHKALLKLFSVEDKQSYVKNFNHIKKYVLDIAIEEINEFTEYNVKYTEVKKGRKTEAIILEWSKGNIKILATESQMQELELYLNGVFTEVYRYLKVADPDRREESFEIVRAFEDLRAMLATRKNDLSYEEATHLIVKVKQNIQILEHNVNYVPTPTRVLYNWLEERE